MLKIEEISGREIVNTRVSKEFKDMFMNVARERFLMTSKLIRKMLWKFVEDPDAMLDFLRRE